MKKITVKNQKNEEKWGAVLENNKTQPWIDECITNLSWGKPERPELDDNGKPTGVILPSEFTVVIEDVVPDFREERRKEFSKLDHEKDVAITEMIVEGRDEAMIAYRLKRAAIKLKYPKA